jgi:hypothetical protein
MKKISLLVFIVAILTSCEHENDNARNLIFRGPSVQAFGGHANTWVQLKTDGTPDRLGITLNEAVFNGVASGGIKGGYMHEGDVALPLHPKADMIAIKDIAIDWDPQGHLPNGIFDLPSFAFHYYMMTEAERQAILNAPTDVQKASFYPAQQYLPQGFSTVAINPVEDRPGGGCFGAHWFDISGPEFNQQKFTQTWSYGTYDGNVAFYMPMFTLEFLEKSDNFVRAIPQPAAFQIDGYYPTVFRVVKHDGFTEIILEEFIYRQAS